ncbi:hypothetical protein KW807_00150 [Candidatus Parcubacteria bacterium]|nr:hypothetical protein [Candidatus Parcubacteria bacterium]
MKIDLSYRQLLIILFSCLLVLYILFQARFLILGPGVTIQIPRDGEVATTSVITVSGTSRNIARITLNDRQIFTDAKGHWSEKLVLSKGLSIITVRVSDHFGREKHESIRVILN